MQEFLIALLEASIAMSGIALVYIAISPLLRKRFAAKGRYYTWLVIIIGLIIPYRFYSQVSIISIDALIPAMETTNSHPVESYAETMSSNIPWTVLVAGLWLAGVTVFITIHVIRHRRFLKMVKRWSTEIIDQQVLNMLQDVQTKFRIEQQVELRVYPNISSPMLLGFIRPTILLPADNIPPDELPLILKHELVHFKRRDVWYKALVLLATALHWFNPFVYMIAREIAIQCEISCDEEVVRNTDVDGRQKYVEAIIGVIRKQTKVQSEFSTNFYSGKHGMKHRVYSIMDAGNKKWGFSILAIIVVATFSTSMMVKISTPESSLNHSVFASENEIDQKSMDDKDDRKMYRSLLEKDKPVSGKENDMSGVVTEVILLMDKDESDTPKLVETE